MGRPYSTRPSRTKDLPRPYSTRPFMTKDLPMPRPLPMNFKPVEHEVAKEDETVIMGGPASKFDGVGSGLPPGAAPRLLSTSSSDEDSAHMSMFQMRGQERENEEEEVDDETDRRR